MLSFLPTLSSCPFGQCSLEASFENKLRHDMQYSVYLQRVYDSGVMVEANFLFIKCAGKKIKIKIDF